MQSICESPSENFPHCVAGKMEVRRIDPLAGAEWNELIAGHPAAGIFHTSEWARVLHRTYGHTPFYSAFYQDGRLAALVPLMEVRSRLTARRGVSIPFADQCAPLLFDRCDGARVVETLADLAVERRWKHLEFRGGESPQQAAAPSVSFYAHTLDLTTGPERLEEGLESAVRRAIRKAGRSGLVTTFRSDEAAVRTFFELHERTRRRHGVPPQPLAFFRNIHREIFGRGKGTVVIVSRGKVPVSASVFFHWGKQAVYKFGACDERLQELRGNNLAMWSGILFLARRGFNSLHFGRTSVAHDGLRRFKLGWGVTETPLHYFRYDVRARGWTSSRDRASGSHNVIFSRLPLSLNRLLGGILYPHLD